MTDERPFTVRDRRNFTADGDLRSETAEPAPASPPAAEPAPAADLPPGGEATLEALFADLAAAVAFHLGLMGEGGESGEAAPKVDLAAARHAISMLELLQSKTQGNRTPREDQVLERLLFELRMAWMSRAQGGAA